MESDTLQVPYRQLHTNRNVWGVEPMVMQPLRFADNPKLQSSKSYRPFGGGHTLCPGRFLAKRAMGFAIALLLCRYDVSIISERTRNGGKWTGEGLPPFPRSDTTKPSPGVSLPHEGDDVVLSLWDRT